MLRSRLTELAPAGERRKEEGAAKEGNMRVGKTRNMERINKSCCSLDSIEHHSWVLTVAAAADWGRMLARPIDRHNCVKKQFVSTLLRYDMLHHLQYL